jgi:hypothetical protein
VALVVISVDCDRVRTRLSDFDTKAEKVKVVETDAGAEKVNVAPLSVFERALVTVRDVVPPLADTVSE